MSDRILRLDPAIFISYRKGLGLDGMLHEISIYPSLGTQILIREQVLLNVAAWPNG